MKTVQFVQMALAVCVGTGMFAATINYVGPGADLANPDNWRPSTWTDADTLVISTNNATFPANGFTLSGDIPASAKLSLTAFPNSIVKIDCGGHGLNTALLDLYNMHNDNNKEIATIFSGGFKDVDAISWSSHRGNIHLTNGVFEAKYGFMLYQWWPRFYILKDAELVISSVDYDNRHGLVFPGVHNDASGAQLVIDGGRIRITGRAGTDYNWQQMRFSGSSATPFTFKIVKGGEYVDDTVMPQDVFYNNLRLIIDGGKYIATNSTYLTRNTRWVGNGATFAMTNGEMRVAQFYTGHATDGLGQGFQNRASSGENARNTKITFHNSIEEFAFAPGVYVGVSLAGTIVCSPDGMVVSSLSTNNAVRLSGDANAWRSGWFVHGGLANTLEVAGGTFNITNCFYAFTGDGCSATFSGGESYMRRFTVASTATNYVIRVTGGAVSTANNIGLNGVSNALEVAGGSFSADCNKITLGAKGARLSVTGGATTGNVEFAANDTTMFVGDGVTHVGARGAGWLGTSRSLFFTPGKSGQVLVISNGTYYCEKPFAHDYATDVTRAVMQQPALKSEAIPFTNCPNSRIEFRGDNPSFITSSAKEHGDSGNSWQTYALGQMYDPERQIWTRDDVALDHPVRLRYVMPKDGYVQAPFRNTNANQGGTLGGNAEFEFDMADYKWPKTKTVIPLVYDAAAYISWGGSGWRNINIDGLNRTNAERLPTNPCGAKCSLSLSADYKTLQLVVPGISSLTIIIR